MKKLLLVLLVLALLAVPLSTGCPAPAPVEAQTVKIGFAHIFPATHYAAATQFPNYFKMVEAATKGKYILDIEYYPVGTLLGGSEICDGVATGIVDAGMSSIAYTPGRFPVLMTLNQPGIAPPVSADAASYTWWEFYNKYKPEEIADVKVLYGSATGPGWLHTKTSVTSVDQMKGLIIRVTGAGVEAVKLVGAEPFACPMGDVYISVQKGLANALVSPIETLEGWKHHELFDYSVSMPYFYSEFFYYVMNLDKWNALPKDLQDAFDDVAEDAVKQAGQIWQYEQKKAMDFCLAQPGGHQFTELPDAEVTKLRELIAPIRAAYIAELNAKGFPGEELVNEAAKIVEKYNKKTYEPWQP